MRDTYTDRLLSYWDPDLRGFKHEGYTHGASDVSSMCGDEVEFRLVIGEGGLEVVDVVASGCCISECCAAMLAELARGKPLAWLDTFDDADWDRHVNVLLPASRRKSCMMLPLQCLRKAAGTELTDAQH